MDKVEANIRKYVAAAKLMQLATVSGSQPWCCTLSVLPDDALQLFWISLPDSRHSLELKANPLVAGAIVAQATAGKPIIGVQLQGRAEMVTDQSEIEQVMRRYTDAFNRGEDFYKEFIAGKNPHKLYKCTPSSFALFDRQDFPDNQYQTWRP